MRRIVSFQRKFRFKGWNDDLLLSENPCLNLRHKMRNRLCVFYSLELLLGFFQVRIVYTLPKRDFYDNSSNDNEDLR